MGRMYYLPMLLLLAVALAGCQKGEKEVEYPPITPSLPPKGSVIGEWERVWESWRNRAPVAPRASPWCSTRIAPGATPREAARKPGQNSRIVSDLWIQSWGAVVTTTS